MVSCRFHLGRTRDQPYTRDQFRERNRMEYRIFDRFIIFIETTGRVDEDSIDRRPLQASVLSRPSRQEEREDFNVVILDRAEIYRIRRELEPKQKGNVSKKKILKFVTYRKTKIERDTQTLEFR